MVPDILTKMRKFCEQLLSEVADAGLASEIVSVDHACYRVGTLERYEKLRREFLESSTLLSEAFINGRPIASFRLHAPVQLASGHSVAVLELPAPKPGKSYSEGFEHIECVTRHSLESFLAAHPHLKFDSSNFNATLNRDVGLELKSGLVKFHEQSLADVIRIEQEEIAGRTRLRGLVLLDFDDTLVVSKGPFLRAMHKALEEHLGRSISSSEIASAARPTFPDFLSNFGIRDRDAFGAVISVFQRHWQDLRTECSIPVGIESTLSCLKSEGIDVAVWTARDLKTTEEFLSDAGLDAYIVRVFAFDEDQPSKPNPAPTLQDLAGNRPVVVIGDSASDAEGAHRLGASFLQAAWVHKNEIAARPVQRICAAPFDALGEAILLIRK